MRDYLYNKCIESKIITPRGKSYLMCKGWVSKFKEACKDPDFKSAVIEWFSSFKSAHEAWYCLYHNIMPESVKCIICGRPAEFVHNKGAQYYSDYCSKECRKVGKSQKMQEVIGNISDEEKESRREKYKKTCLERYGSEDFLSSEKGKKRAKEGLLDKYGVTHNSQIPGVIEKMRNTNIEKYGGAAPICNKEIKDKIKETCLEKYGVENPSQNIEIRNKQKQTCFERHKVENYLSAEEFKEKSLVTMQEKYGVDNAFQIEENRQKALDARKEFFNKKYEDLIKETSLQKDSLITNLEDLKSYYDRGGVACTIRCEECGSTKILWNRKTIKRYLNRKVSKILCKNCGVVDGKLRCSTVLQNKLHLWNCHSKEDQLYRGALTYLPREERPTYEFICDLCGKEFKDTLPMGNERPVCCPECYSRPATGSSITEKDVALYIKEIYKGRIIEHNRSVLHPRELDIYLPDINLAIEIDGVYWHREDSKTYNKYIECLNKDVNLIVISDHDWRYKKEIAKNYIKSFINNVCGDSYIKKISAEEAKALLNSCSLIKKNLSRDALYYGVFKEDLLIRAFGVKETSIVCDFGIDHSYENLLLLLSNTLINNASVDNHLIDYKNYEKAGFTLHRQYPPRLYKASEKFKLYTMGKSIWKKK